jgi:hypothetical protein
MAITALDVTFRVFAKASGHETHAKSAGIWPQHEKSRRSGIVLTY